VIYHVCLALRWLHHRRGVLASFTRNAEQVVIYKTLIKRVKLAKHNTHTTAGAIAK
jgi:hypothetical protein